MLRLRDLGSNTPLGVPYTGEEIVALVRKGKQRGHIPGVGKVVSEKGKTAIFAAQPRGTYTEAKIDEMLTSRDKTIDKANLVHRGRSAKATGVGVTGVGMMSRAGMGTLAGMMTCRTHYIWMESFETQECPSLIQNYFDTHTVDGVFPQDEARVQYEEMIRLRDLGANTLTGVPYTEDQIMAMVRRGKQWGHIPGVSRVLAGQGRDAISINEPRCTHTNADVDEVNEDNKRLRKELAMLRTIIRSDDRMSQLLTQLESEHEIDSDSGSGRGGDDEPGTNEDAGRDEDDDGDEES
nr:hypothetical protein [Tanacetum cinerariifolium]